MRRALTESTVPSMVPWKTINGGIGVTEESSGGAVVLPRMANIALVGPDAER